MGAQLRVYRQKIESTKSTQKIFKAMEMMATSRIAKARSRVSASTPYARAITRAVSAVASQHDIDHILTVEPERVRRSLVLVLTSDRGLAGSYSANALKKAEGLVARIREAGSEPVLYLVGRKAQAYYQFRRREFARSWTGDTDAPTYALAKEISEAVLEAFATDDDKGGVDEIHVVYTQFQSMVSQVPQVLRLLPLEVSEEQVSDDADLLPLYEFEPEPAQVLDALLPRYIESRIFAALLQSSASELASRQRAMKQAGDNAADLIRTYTRLANNARQAEITQELSEIVAGADALAAS